jgi:hypothetical protein
MLDSPPSPVWSGEHVCELLVRARRAFSGRVLVVSGGTPGKVWGTSAVLIDGPPGCDAAFPPGPLKVLHWIQRYTSEHPTPLPRHEWGPSERVVIREYLRIRAHNGSAGTINELVRSKGRTWQGFDRIRRRVCERIAADLTARGVPWFDLHEDGELRGGLLDVSRA